jgi:hypothetical protein
MMPISRSAALVKELAGRFYTGLRIRADTYALLFIMLGTDTASLPILPT